MATLAGGSMAVAEPLPRRDAPLHLMRCLIVRCAGMDMPSTRCATVSSRRVFFRRSRLFFRNGEGGEWRASRVTVGVKAKDNGGACFTLDFDITHTIGRQPSHPHRGDFLFFSIHLKQTQPSLLRLRGSSYYMAKACLFKGGGEEGTKKACSSFFLEGELQAMVYEERVVKPLRVIF